MGNRAQQRPELGRWTRRGKERGDKSQALLIPLSCDQGQERDKRMDRQMDKNLQMRSGMPEDF